MVLEAESSVVGHFMTDNGPMRQRRIETTWYRRKKSQEKAARR
jgi:hypothetical protein